MARSLNSDEAEAFKNTISPERKFTQEYGSFEGLLERQNEELELTADSAFWLPGYIATNS
jgi:hypothetical protein